MKLNEVLDLISRNEFEGIVVDETQKGSKWPEKYKGLLLHISDHGNLELYRVFKNGKTKSLESRV